MAFTTMRDYMFHYLTKYKNFDVNTSELKFAENNAKLTETVTFSMPAGHSCPYAKDCRSCGIRNPRKRHDIGDKRKFIIKDGPHTKFRCFVAVEEVMYREVRNSRWWNYLLILNACQKGKWAVVNLIEKTLPKNNLRVRIDVAGDFFNQIYFDAWLQVARRHPERLFYAYTKAIPLWVKRINSIPNNVKLTASYGGTHDYLIEQYNLKYAKVVTSVQEARMMGLRIDHDDSLAYGSDKSFALLLHGQQPAGPMAVAWYRLKKMGTAGYGVTKDATKALGAKSFSAVGVLLRRVMA
jgi:hypothetical protein